MVPLAEKHSLSKSNSVYSWHWFWQNIFSYVCTKVWNVGGELGTCAEHKAAPRLNPTQTGACRVRNFTDL